MGLLAGRNDLELLERTRTGRDINRHCYSLEEVGREAERPVVRRLLNLLRFRNRCRAFDGEFSLERVGTWALNLIWTLEGETAELRADFRNGDFAILHRGAAVSLED